MFTWTELSREVSLATRNGPLNMVMMIFNWDQKKGRLWLISNHGTPSSKTEKITHFGSGGGKHQEHKHLSEVSSADQLHKLSYFYNLKFAECWLHFKQNSYLFWLTSTNIWTFPIHLFSNIWKYQLNLNSQPLMTDHTLRKSIKNPKFWLKLATGER